MSRTNDRPAARAAEADPTAHDGGGGVDFVRAIVEEDTRSGRYGGRVLTRFPPEPNGFLHIGHAKSICLNFGVAEEFAGACNLRFDDTNPETEDETFVEAIQEDVAWLGFEWADVFFASDYFEQLYDFAEQLIARGKAYVDSASEEEIRELRGTVTEPGRPSMYRDRPVEENLDLFRRMRAGEFPNGAHVLRARIDLTSHNMLLRDPVLYRIRHASHYRTEDAWCIYPLYDFTHCLSDALEGITHSVCTLEFENNRALYDWVLDEAGFEEPRPHQYEFNRLNLDYTVMSKRKLMQLVSEGLVNGWDDPRMPTIAGLRRRGVTPASIRAFCAMIGVAKTESRVDLAKLEYAIRDDLNQTAPRVMAVLRPLRVVVTTFGDETDWLDAPLYPHDVPLEGSRSLPFTRELYIEQDDFAEVPPKGWRRWSPGEEVRLRYGYIVRCDEVVKGADGRVVEIRCSHDPASRGGTASDGRPIRGTIHWVSRPHAQRAEVRLYDRLFTEPDPEGGPDGTTFHDFLNAGSLTVLEDAWVEPSVSDDTEDTRYQFERLGYFWRDPVDASPARPVFNRIVTLRDTWARSVRAERAVRPETKERDRAAAAEQPGERVRSGTAPALNPAEQARFEQLTAELDLSRGDARTIATHEILYRLLDQAIEAGASPPAVGTWLVNELLRELKDPSADTLPFGGDGIARLLELVADDTLSVGTARDVFSEMVRGEGSPDEIVDRGGYRQISGDGALGPVVLAVVARHPDEAGRYREGKKALLGFFVGQVMRETGGRANPSQVRALLEDALA